MSVGLVMAGLSIGQSIYGAFQQQDYYADMATNLRKQRQALKNLIPSIEGQAEVRGKLATEEYGDILQSMREQVNVQYADVLRGAEETEAKSGFAYSGAVQQKAETQTGALKSQFKAGEKARQTGLERALTEIDIESKNAITNLETQISALDDEVKYADEKASSWTSNLFG